MFSSFSLCPSFFAITFFYILEYIKAVNLPFWRRRNKWEGKHINHNFIKMTSDFFYEILRITLSLRPHSPSLSPSHLSPGITGQKVRVEEELEAYPTESVDLRCQFIDGGGRTKLTQVRRCNTALLLLVAENVKRCLLRVEWINWKKCKFWRSKSIFHADMEGPRKKLKLPVQILPLKSGAQGETYTTCVYFRIRKQDIMCLYTCLDGKEIGLRCESWGIEKKQNVTKCNVNQNSQRVT